MKIYLDACCFSRPFDKKSNDRIMFEANAIITIFRHIELGEIELIISDILEYEIQQIPDLNKKMKVNQLLFRPFKKILTNDEIMIRGIELEKLGLKSYDALQIASAEYGKADIFLTTDDLILKKFKKNKKLMNIEIQNPLEFIKEII